MGDAKPSDPKSLGVSLNHHISRARQSITVMTSSWGDCSAGPLGLCIPDSLLPQKELDKFNKENAGRAFAVRSGGRRHFMTSASWIEMLYKLYAPALALQRNKYNLSLEVKGKFLADAWTGFRADEGSVERSAWQQLHNVAMPFFCCRLFFCCLNVKTVG